MESIIKLFQAHGTLVQPESLEYILSKDDPSAFCQLISKQLKEFPLILTLNQIKHLEEEGEKKPVSSLSSQELELKEHQHKILTELYTPSSTTVSTPDEDLGDEDLNSEDTFETDEGGKEEEGHSPLYSSTRSWNPPAKNIAPQIKIIKDVSGKSTCEGTTDDFCKLFSNRFDVLRKILRSQRRELNNVIPINRMRKAGLKEIQLIGIINEVHTTQNGHRIIQIEDDTGELTAIVLQHNQEIFPMSLELITDEIIGLAGQLSKNGDLFIVNNIIYPDISLHNRKYNTTDPIAAAFLSDIHVGSREFMDKQWSAFIRWINGDLGNSRQKRVAGTIKYLVIPGDVVDGIGIYPNQEKELTIVDLYSQYEELARQFQQIPEHISVIMQPGNHDAVRPAEPQPTFNKQIQDLFSSNDITFIGNPAQFSMHEVEVLSYHGQSLLDFATNIQRLKYNEPVEIMKIMLQKHHLAPIYGGYTPLAPEHHDYMIINRIPDIFVTGHVHLAMIGEYRGITLINASSWQAQTSYQKMLNFTPDPAKLPIADLKTGNVTMMDFTKQVI